MRRLRFLQVSVLEVEMLSLFELLLVMLRLVVHVFVRGSVVRVPFRYRWGSRCEAGCERGLGDGGVEKARGNREESGTAQKIRGGRPRSAGGSEENVWRIMGERLRAGKKRRRTGYLGHGEKRPVGVLIPAAE
jgi:hypothetical protein